MVLWGRRVTQGASPGMLWDSVLKKGSAALVGGCLVVRHILHVNTDDFFASVLRVRDPRLRGKAVVVAMDSPRGVVFSASYEARGEGIRRGMSVSVARRLAPRAVFVPPDWPLFRKVSSAIFSVLQRYSPLVERDGLDEGFVDYTGCDRLFGPVVDVGGNIFGHRSQCFPWGCFEQTRKPCCVQKGEEGASG